MLFRLCIGVPTPNTLSVTVDVFTMRVTECGWLALSDVTIITLYCIVFKCVDVQHNYLVQYADQNVCARDDSHDKMMM